MGANAQTSVPAFTTGQVLTAQQQTEINTGVPVFATTTTRDAAFGGTGEKTLAKGQLAYIEATDVVQYYNGTSWATLAPQTLSSGLNYITGASFTTATSVSLPNNTFSSTYRNYKVTFAITAVTSDADFTVRLRASGSDITTANYTTLLYGADNNGTSGALTNSGGTSWLAGEQDNTTVRYIWNFDVLQPQIAEQTFLTGFITYVNKTVSGTFSRNGSAMFVTTTQADSLTFISSVASSITGVYRVYGYSDS